MSDQYLDEEEYLKSQLAELQRAYQKQAQPYIDRLTAIYALRPMPPVVIDLNELKEETSKYFYAMIGAEK